MNTRILSGLAVAALACTMLTACGPSSKTPDGRKIEAKPKTSEPVAPPGADLNNQDRNKPG